MIVLLSCYTFSLPPPPPTHTPVSRRLSLSPLTLMVKGRGVRSNSTTLQMMWMSVFWKPTDQQLFVNHFVPQVQFTQENQIILSIRQLLTRKIASIFWRPGRKNNIFSALPSKTPPISKQQSPCP